LKAAHDRTYLRSVINLAAAPGVERRRRSSGRFAMKRLRLVDVTRRRRI
jgi:hypothetical protein